MGEDTRQVPAAFHERLEAIAKNVSSGGRVNTRLGALEGEVPKVSTKLLVDVPMVWQRLKSPKYFPPRSEETKKKPGVLRWGALFGVKLNYKLNWRVDAEGAVLESIELDQGRHIKRLLWSLVFIAAALGVIYYSLQHVSELRELRFLWRRSSRGGGLGYLLILGPPLVILEVLGRIALRLCSPARIERLIRTYIEHPVKPSR
ncbi:MAG: hypothetical protein KDB07_10115, partial [Planctomycetes bacterium]|nr:hypothetical protein [Planctomycetota bacterium]